MNIFSIIEIIGILLIIVGLILLFSTILLTLEAKLIIGGIGLVAAANIAERQHGERE